MKNCYRPTVLLMIFLFCGQGNSAPNQSKHSDEDVIIGTTVIGNAEFPKVEYKRPWKTVQMDTVEPEMMRKNKATIDLHYIDKQALQRKLKLYKHLRMTRREN